MSEKILIQFKASGDARLRASMIKLAASQALLEKNTKQFRKSLSDLTKGFETHQRRLRNTSGAFSTLRSQMLLFSFAMSLGGRQIIKFGKDAAVMEQMETAFTNLSGGTENATIAIDRLRDATDRTMSNFDLFQQANNAMVLGVTKNSEEMAEMFDMAQRLGKALGVDTKRSIESLVTGIGRQSKLMLDNIGIMVKADEAYESYAIELKKNKEDLTDVEKKQAFLNATLKAAKQALQGVGPEQITALENLQQFSAAADNLTTRIGDFLLPALASAAEVFSILFDAFDEQRIKSYASAIAVVTLGLGLYYRASLLAIAGTKSFKAALIGTGIGAALIVLGEIITALAKKFGFFNTAQENTISRTQRAVQALREQKKAMQGLQETLDSYLEALSLEATMNHQKLVGDKEAVYVTGELLKLKKAGVVLGEQEQKDIIEMLKLNFGLIQQKKEEDERTKQAYAEYVKRAEEQKKIDEDTAKAAEENADRIAAATISQVSALTEAMAQAALAGEHMGRAVENALKRVAAQFAAQSVLFGILKLFGIGIPAPTLFGFNSFGHQGGQVQGYATGGVVPPPGIPSYATGGGVDNVPAMLQEGEYVMRRSAVESIGIENLNRMNRTGRVSGGVNINFTGNVLSRDFIEDEAVPLIKNALRKGGDLGLA